MSKALGTKKDIELRLRERDSLDAMLKRYLGSLQRGIITPEAALRNLRADYARYFEEL